MAGPFRAVVIRAYHTSELRGLMWLDHCPLFAPLRSDPRWGQLHAEVSRTATLVRNALVNEGIV